jgi:hypothetical protein
MPDNSNAAVDQHLVNRWLAGETAPWAEMR